MVTALQELADAPSATTYLIPRTTVFVVATAEFRRPFRGFAGVGFLGDYAETMRGQDLRDTGAFVSRGAHGEYGCLLKTRG